MKTLEDLFREVMASDKMKTELIEVSDSKEKIMAWLRKHGCAATLDELGDFLRAKTEGEISDSDAEAVAGGKTNAGIEALVSVLFG